MNINTALGFAMKAGKIACGDFSVEKAVKCGKAKLVVLDTAASTQTRKKWNDMCAYREIKIIEVSNACEAVGKNGRVIIAVTDSSFAELILKIYNGCSAASE